MSRLAPYFQVDALALFVGLFLVLFFVLTILYSSRYLQGKERLGQYYACIVLTLLTALGAVFSNHLVVFLVCWGFLAFLLYLLIGFGSTDRTPSTAKKALIIVGGSDALMVLGFALIWRLAGSLRMDEIQLGLTSWPAIGAFLCLVSGALAKAGAMPFHSWVPDTATDAPIPVTAYLPASLDKLLGIYFLIRIALKLFRMTPAANTLLMMVGSFTILAAVMMALAQHDLKRLLGYHAVSQVGYMVLGIGTGSPVGIAGGLFHMLNNAIYKACLFYGGGAVEKSAGTTDMENLGGLARSMPVTFGSFLVASLAISGVPPLNGFASKWMIYQGIIESARGGGHLWVLWLVAAMFGSALTLASFMKVVHAVFLGQPSRTLGQCREVSALMWVPSMTLALLSVVFGVLASPIPLRMLIYPSLGYDPLVPGTWNAGLATGLILVGLGVGFLIYLMGNVMTIRETEIFVGGERAKDHPEMRVSGTEFYYTIQNMAGLKTLYEWAERRRLDPYDLGIALASGVTKVLQHLHNGILPTYLAWCLLGATVLLFILLR